MGPTFLIFNKVSLAILFLFHPLVNQYLLFIQNQEISLHPYSYLVEGHPWIFQGIYAIPLPIILCVGSKQKDDTPADRCLPKLSQAKNKSLLPTSYK